GRASALTAGPPPPTRPSPAPGPSPTPRPALTPCPSATLLPSPPPPPSPTPLPTPVPPAPAPGLPVHLVIPSVKIDTPVVELDTSVDEAGNLEWDTVPFVAGHYGMTGLAGARANVVLAGHVATHGMGNFFPELYPPPPAQP